MGQLSHLTRPKKENYVHSYQLACEYHSNNCEVERLVSFRVGTAKRDFYEVLQIGCQFVLSSMVRIHHGNLEALTSSNHHLSTSYPSEDLDVSG